MDRQLQHNGKTAVYADCSTLPYIDLHKEIRRKSVVVASEGLTVASDSPIRQVTDALDWMKWLPFCAQAYHISPHPEDYILLPTIICPSDLPNRNGVGFPLRELVAWEPEMKRQVYRGWKGCPTFSEHANTDNTKARGVVIDSVMKKVQGVHGNLWKVMGLAAFDRNKYPDVAHRLLTRTTTTVSMGAYVSSYSCGACGAPAGSCGHINLRRPRDFYLDSATGKLVYRKCHGITPFELSEVQTPAWSVAESPHTIDLANKTAYQ